ncbi:MAG: hypothetical protein JEZ11_07415 [Desulfobacterales bacterium]|nr:hypothetical protein [Desulfobacterales bacterium]
MSETQSKQYSSRNKSKRQIKSLDQKRIFKKSTRSIMTNTKKVIIKACLAMGIISIADPASFHFTSRQPKIDISRASTAMSIASGVDKI